MVHEAWPRNETHSRGHDHRRAVHQDARLCPRFVPFSSRFRRELAGERMFAAALLFVMPETDAFLLQ